MLSFSSLPIKTPHIKLELYFPSSLQSERDTVKLLFALCMLTIYLIMGHNNWTLWGDKDTFCSLLVENSMPLDQTHNSAWKDITRLHGKDISLRTPRSLLAHQSIALHFAQFPWFFLYVWLENAVLKRPSHSMGIKYFHSRGIHTLPSTFRRSVWSYRYLWYTCWKGLPYKTISIEFSIFCTPGLQEEGTPSSNGNIGFLSHISQSVIYNLPFLSRCAN